MSETGDGGNIVDFKLCDKIKYVDPPIECSLGPMDMWADVDYELLDDLSEEQLKIIETIMFEELFMNAKHANDNGDYHG